MRDGPGVDPLSMEPLGMVAEGHPGGTLPPGRGRRGKDRRGVGLGVNLLGMDHQGQGMDRQAVVPCEALLKESQGVGLLWAAGHQGSPVVPP